MDTKGKQKLRLNKETIKNLSDDSLSKAAGGDGASVVIIGCSVVCSILAFC